MRGGLVMRHGKADFCVEAIRCQFSPIERGQTTDALRS